VDEKGSLYSVGTCLLQLPYVVLDGERSRVDFLKGILVVVLWKDVLQIKEQVENS